MWIRAAAACMHATMARILDPRSLPRPGSMYTHGSWIPDPHPDPDLVIRGRRQQQEGTGGVRNHQGAARRQRSVRHEWGVPGTASAACSRVRTKSHTANKAAGKMGCRQPWWRWRVVQRARGQANPQQGRGQAGDTQQGRGLPGDTIKKTP